jgi:hypothetical protein
MNQGIRVDETAADGPQRERHVITQLGEFKFNSGADWYFHSPTRRVLGRTVAYEEPISTVEEDVAELEATTEHGDSA